MPYLKEICFKWDKAPEQKMKYPFNIKALHGIKDIKLDKNVTFFIGENGCGKSTLLEAIAYNCGFAAKGGSRNSTLYCSKDEISLASIITLSWLPKVSNGFFFRAETFFDYASYIDDLAEIDPDKAYSTYGGKSLHKQSHGEAFFALMSNRFSRKGIYILDEPESALSPQRQLALLRIIWDMVKNNKAQFLIATHSPILMAYPDAQIYSLDESPMKTVNYVETEHYQVTKGFINNRDKILNELLKG